MSLWFSLTRLGACHILRRGPSVCKRPSGGKTKRAIVGEFRQCAWVAREKWLAGAGIPHSPTPSRYVSKETQTPVVFGSARPVSPDVRASLRLQWVETQA